MSLVPSKLDHPSGWVEPRAPGVQIVKLPRPLTPSFEGLLALLVTDLVGFTSLVERLGDVPAQRLIQYHNRLLRRCIKDRCGHEVTHTGDGMLAAFRSVSAALWCAGDIQRALAQDICGEESARLRARIGVHVGEPLPEEERLFGHCVNTTMRVCAKASAGGVLVTAVVEQLAQGRFVFGRVRRHALKGIASPMRLYELDWQS